MRIPGDVFILKRCRQKLIRCLSIAAALLEEGCRKFKDRPAYACMRKQITFGELDKLSQQFASFLQNDLKLQKGERLAIQMPNNIAVSSSYVWRAAGWASGGQYQSALYAPRNATQFKDS